ncbi:MAG: TAXI family TRAP transporter solute-binding subunit [Desulfobacteraceae bacterium]|jgi:TRAP transporter TAXI family solute receptor
MDKHFWTKVGLGILVVSLTVAFSMLNIGGVASAKQWPKSLTLTTPPAGATLSVYGMGIAKIVEGALKIPTGPENAKGSFPAAMLLVKGDAQLAAITACEKIYGFYDRSPFPKGSSKILRGITFGEYKAVGHWIVRAKSEFQSIPDLKGKRVMCVRPRQALYQDNWKATLAAYGMTEKDIVAKPALGQRDACAALKERRTDAFFHHSAAPGPAFMELALTTPIRIVPLTDAGYKKVKEKCPWVSPIVVPAGTYKGQSKDALQTATFSGIVTRNDLPDDLVYNIAKAIHENMDQLRSVHKAFTKWTMKGLVNGPVTCPYHAGALKYYKEKGLVTPESLKTHEALLAKSGQSR